MSEVNFTKGDVKIVKHLLSDMFDLRIGFCGHSEGELIARVMSGEDDANLLGAASAMYEMLESLAEQDECQMLKYLINKVLAKARGE